MAGPVLLRTALRMRAWSRRQRAAGRTVGFVPTMGALHQGHLSLVRRAIRDCDRVVASIFVNPIQFAPGEDYLKYPRALARDQRLLATEGVHALFVPSAAHLYPRGFQTRIQVPELSRGPPSWPSCCRRWNPTCCTWAARTTSRRAWWSG